MHITDAAIKESKRQNCKLQKLLKLPLTWSVKHNNSYLPAIRASVFAVTDNNSSAYFGSR